MNPTQYLEHGRTLVERFVSRENVISLLAICGALYGAWHMLQIGARWEAVYCLGIAGAVAVAFVIGRSLVKTCEAKHVLTTPAQQQATTELEAIFEPAGPISRDEIIEMIREATATAKPDS